MRAFGVTTFATVLGALGIFAAAAAACGGRRAAPIPAKYADVAEIHHASCGNCHVRVEPGKRTRAQLEKALVRHRSRVKMSEREWALIIDYLTETP